MDTRGSALAGFDGADWLPFARQIDVDVRDTLRPFGIFHKQVRKLKRRRIVVLDLNRKRKRLAGINNGGTFDRHIDAIGGNDACPVEKEIGCRDERDKEKNN